MWHEVITGKFQKVWDYLDSPWRWIRSLMVTRFITARRLLFLNPLQVLSKVSGEKKSHLLDHSEQVNKWMMSPDSFLCNILSFAALTVTDGCIGCSMNGLVLTNASLRGALVCMPCSRYPFVKHQKGRKMLQVIAVPEYPHLQDIWVFFFLQLQEQY